MDGVHAKMGGDFNVFAQIIDKDGLLRIKVKLVEQETKNGRLWFNQFDTGRDHFAVKKIKERI